MSCCEQFHMVERALVAAEAGHFPFPAFPSNRVWEKFVAHATQALADLDSRVMVLSVDTRERSASSWGVRLTQPFLSFCTCTIGHQSICGTTTKGEGREKEASCPYFCRTDDMEPCVRFSPSSSQTSDDTVQSTLTCYYDHWECQEQTDRSARRWNMILWPWRMVIVRGSARDNAPKWIKDNIWGVTNWQIRERGSKNITQITGLQQRRRREGWWNPAARHTMAQEPPGLTSANASNTLQAWLPTPSSQLEQNKTSRSLPSLVSLEPMWQVWAPIGRFVLRAV